MKVYFPGLLLFSLNFITNSIAQTPLNPRINFPDLKTITSSGWINDPGESNETPIKNNTFEPDQGSDIIPPLLALNERRIKTPSNVSSTFFYTEGNNISSTGITFPEEVCEAKTAVITSAFMPGPSAEFNSPAIPIEITDAPLSIDAKGSIATKIDNVSIMPAFSAIAPVVSITSPVANQNFTAPATITFIANATAVNATVTKVEFYAGTTLINTQQTAPYEFAWQNVSSGSYTLTAKATDSEGGITTSSSVLITVSSGSGNLPTVNLITPSPNQNFTAPAVVNITANAAAVNATISKVEFYNGTTLLNTQGTSPYEFAWQNVPAGSYTITAKATDSKGNSATSSPIPITVSSGSGNPPTVNITTPAPNQNFTPPATININANATAVNATVSKVEFYNGTILLNTQNNAPYQFTWQNVPAGNYIITARATDSKGSATTSSPVPVTVSAGSNTPPAISITAPITNQNFAPPATFDITANATAVNATISKVEFYNGSTLLNTQRTAPYKYTWQNVPAGNYTLTAKATDSKNISTTSTPVPITVSTNKKPSVVSVNPANGAGNVSANTSVSTNIINLPNSGIDNNTITSTSVYLSTGGVKVTANVNGTGGGDAIILVPVAALKPNTTYTFTITSGVKDLSGASFVPYTSTFTTGATVTPPSTTVKFTKTNLANAAGEYSALAIGPDKKLYALTIDGVIRRFVINPDGTLGNPQFIYSLQDSNGVRKQTLAISLAFDPSSTSTNLIAWVSHCRSYVFLDAPDWDGKLTRLSGPNLQTSKTILINLPRSAKDHVTNGIAFGPDNALYFSQGSISGMGMADNIWGNRAEHLLSCAILRLDVSKIGTFPLNVKTADGGGTYDPYASNAPLTIYASGVRNAYHLVWHSNGSLYVPTNGSAPGSNTPASVNGTRRPNGTIYNGPAVPALINVQQTQFDYLYKVVKGGYYGHPNPTRGEFVMNGGNPTAGIDKAEVPAYAVGTQPDINWRGIAFDFKNNSSPDGAIEYKSNTFNGALKGRLLVVRYSGHDDIITLSFDNNKNVSGFIDGKNIPGFSGFIDPLALVEDATKGNIYVSEFGGRKLTLLKPDFSTAQSRQSAADTATYPNPEFVSVNYPNINSSCDDTSPNAIKTKPDNNYNNNAFNPFGKIKISPNPAMKKFTIGISNQYDGNYKIQIVNATGITQEILNARIKGLNLEIDITRLALKPGVYFLKLTSKRGNSEYAKLMLL